MVTFLRYAIRSRKKAKKSLEESLKVHLSLLLSLRLLYHKTKKFNKILCENKPVQNVFEMNTDFHISVIFMVSVLHILSQVFSPEHLYYGA